MEVVSGQFVQESTVLPVPDPHHPVTSRRESSAVGTECHGIRRPKLANGVVRFSEYRLAGRRQVPDLYLPVRAEEARCLPSRWNATLTTESVCAGNCWMTSPVLLFQILTSPSSPAEARRSPSGLNATP